MREIGEHFQISSPNGVMCHLRALEKKGLLQRVRKHDRAIARAIELAPEIMAEEKGMPLAGTVAAGLTTLAFEQAERVDFAQMFSKKSLFALKVKGDSMIDAQIDDGDYVVVKKQKTAQSGQMVVAQTPEGEATLKYWHPEANRIRLQPANSSMSPIYVKEASVMGVVVGVVRNMHLAPCDATSARRAGDRPAGGRLAWRRMAIRGWTTPNFNRLAARSVLCETVIADSPDLDESYRGYWTGRHAMGRRRSERDNARRRWLSRPAAKSTLLLTDDSRVAEHPLASGFGERRVLPVELRPKLRKEIEQTGLFAFFRRCDAPQSRAERSRGCCGCIRAA